MFFKDENINTIIMSILWGFGLACIFKKVCENNCIVITAPDDVNEYVEHVDNKCYKFTKNNLECG
jgi:hypothetical protein